MGLMSWLRSDRVLLLSLGVCGIGVVSTMYVMLLAIKDDNKIRPQQPKTQYITQDTEDSLPLGTIEKLISHPNYSIREVAIKILCDRTLDDSDAIQQLLFGITQKDYEYRMQCLRALAFLMDQTNDGRSEGLSKLHTTESYSAFVRSFELGLDDVRRPRLDDSFWDEYHLRDMAEQFCITLSYELIHKFGPDQLVKAGFVEKWLARQNWGDSDEQIQHNFRDYRRSKKNRIREMIDIIRRSKLGLAALKRARLVAKDEQSSGEATPDNHLRVLLEIGFNDDDNGPFERILERTIPRPNERSAEEQRLRRQHREAMVLNDGTRPIRREDIIERGRDFLQDM